MPQSLIEKSSLCATETQMRRALGLQGLFGARVPIAGLGTTCRGHLSRRGISRKARFDIVEAWSVCRLGRSLFDLTSLLGGLPSGDTDLYVHQQALDASTPSGRALFGMLGLFSKSRRSDACR